MIGLFRGNGRGGVAPGRRARRGSPGARLPIRFRPAGAGVATRFRRSRAAGADPPGPYFRDGDGRTHVLL